jgi:hypothetical protein
MFSPTLLPFRDCFRLAARAVRSAFARLLSVAFVRSAFARGASSCSQRLRHSPLFVRSAFATALCSFAALSRGTIDRDRVVSRDTITIRSRSRS